jgi:hypothetical protein
VPSPIRASSRVWTRPGLVLALLVAASAGVRFWAATRIPSPWITPDEQTYGELGRSLWHSGRFEILGRSTEPLSLVQPVLIGAPLEWIGGVGGYTAAKTVQAVVMSLAAAPVYLWGRTLAAPRWALAAAALTLAAPGLVYSGFLMTEVSFYPVLVLCAWAMASALVEPTLDRQAILLGTMLLAFATRLQAVVLVPVLLLALLLKLWFDGGGVRLLRRFVPLFAGIAAVAVIWSVLVLRGHQSASGLLGTYGAAAQGSYHAGSVVKFGVYHVGDLVLMTGVFGAVALGLLFARAVAGREESERARSFVAVTTACCAGFVAEVGLFASRNLGRLGERYLLALAPLCFLALAVWLDRGAPRPRIATAALAAVALATLAVLPARFFSEAAAPDAPATVLVRDVFGGERRLGLPLVAAALLALLALVPRRLVWLLPAVALALLAAGSVSATRFDERQARGYERTVLGGDRRWIDRFASGPALFVYGGEAAWSGGGPVWAHLFWNRRIDAVVRIGPAPVYGPIDVPEAQVAPDGRLLVAGREVSSPFVVAANAWDVPGTLIAQGGGYVLWLPKEPIRLVRRPSS